MWAETFRRIRSSHYEDWSNPIPVSSPSPWLHYPIFIFSPNCHLQNFSNPLQLQNSFTSLPLAMLQTSTHHHFPPQLLPRHPLCLRISLIISAHRRPLLRHQSYTHIRLRVSSCTKSSSKNTVAELVKAVDGQKANDQQQQQVKRPYPFHEIEPKWQHYWEENKTFRTPDEIDTSKPKFYVLDMFPYPRFILLSHSFNFNLLCAKDWL